MYRLLESIKIKNKKVYNLEYHIDRVKRTVKSLGLADVHLKEELKKVILPADNHLYKLRFLYGGESPPLIELSPYSIPRIKSLKPVFSNSIEYPFKFTDRKQLKKLYDSRGKHDDILIVKNGLITDSYYGNTVFFDPREGWITPANPLLKGSKRAYYLDKKKIKEGDINPEFIYNYTKMCLINAMIDIGEVELKTTNIKI